MTQRRGKRDVFLYAIVLFCLFSFKLIFINVGGGSTGIRADDVLILVAFLVLLARGDLRRIRRTRAFNIYLLFGLVNFVSAVWNSIEGRISLLISLLFVLRLFQYMVFYYLGFLMARSGRRFVPVMVWYLVLMAAVVPLQMLGIVPVPGAFTNITSRAVGNTNGPYELAGVTAFFICYLGYQHRRKIGGFVAFGLLVLSASRITFIGSILSGVRVLIKRATARTRIATLASLLVIGAIVGFTATVMHSDSLSEIYVFDRLSDVASSTLLDGIVDIYRYSPTYQVSSDYLDGLFMHHDVNAAARDISGDKEASGAQRVFQWACLIKSALLRPDTALIGLGPSFGGAAVDGYFVRVFVETGLLGIVVFLVFAVLLMRERKGSSWPFREYVFMLLVTGSFIDIFVSYKPMLLLWLWYGILQYHAAQANRSAARPVVPAERDGSVPQSEAA